MSYLLTNCQWLVAGHLIKIEFLFRKVRNVNKPFGGIQIILTGDLQLSPEPNLEYGDDGSLLIASSLMDTFHIIKLNEIHRQNEPFSYIDGG